MPCDRNRQEIHAGDLVYVPCKVLAVFDAVDRNLSLEILGTAAEASSGRFLGFDSDQVVRVPDDVAGRLSAKFRLNGR